MYDRVGRSVWRRELAACGEALPFAAFVGIVRGRALSLIFRCHLSYPRRILGKSKIRILSQRYQMAPFDSSGFRRGVKCCMGTARGDDFLFAPARRGGRLSSLEFPLSLPRSQVRGKARCGRTVVSQVRALRSPFSTAFC